MIEVKNLKKTYVTKGNVVTKALDDVSIKFPEKGLVFLLGKSGSGKSTLLNMLGGLDKVDSGEVIIMGRSSSSFSSSDFDSYRNTFIGFIFQEYNILNEFSVEENLSLALELQGKKSNKEKVKQLLKDVDLEGFGKRKPNTLSGGQKQRIAIARALIKEPKIIMADEPTGALDSKTGKQVFDTLKKLSTGHLIIVVSHDREFAEVYGDRIIELKDGKVISDETKNHIPAKELNNNLSIIGNNTLSIKDCKNLSEDDTNEILKFIKESDNLIIASSSEDIKSFKKSNRITDDNKTETFTPTIEEPMKEYSKEESKFIKSHLPLSKATRMGLSSLKIKPFRLILTMLLTIVSFLMFGVSSTLMVYNENTAFKNSFKNSEYKTVNVTNNFNYISSYYRDGNKQSSYTSSAETYFTEEEYQKLANEYGKDILPIYSLSSNEIRIENISSNSETPQTLTSQSIKGLATQQPGSKYEDLLCGTLPLNEFEVAIPEFIAKKLLLNNFYDKSNNKYHVTSYNDLIDKLILLSINGYSYDFTIKGVYKNDEMPSKYSRYDEYEYASNWSMSNVQSFRFYISETGYDVILTPRSTYEAIMDNNYYHQSSYVLRYLCFHPSKQYELKYEDNFDSYNYYVEKISNANYPITYFNGFDSNTTDGIVIPLSTFRNFVSFKFHDFNIKDDDITRFENATLSIFNSYMTAKYSELEEYMGDKWEYFYNNYYTYIYNNNIADLYLALMNLDSKYNVLYDEIVNNEEYINQRNAWDNDSYNSNEVIDKYNNFNSSSKTVKKYMLLRFYTGLLQNSNYYEILRYISCDSFTEQQRNDLIYFIGEIYLNDNYGITINVSNDDTVTSYQRLIIGFYDDSDAYDCGIYTINDSDYDLLLATSYSEYSTNYKEEKSSTYYSSIFVPLNSQKNILDNINKTTENDTFLSLNNTLGDRIRTISSMVSIMKQVFFYVGIVLAVFSALLLFNFITVSISSKTHEIGVLRAVGARGKDVFKIFFSESLFISIVCLIIAIIGAIIIVKNLNIYITNELGYPLHLLSFGLVSTGIMLGISLLVAFLGTFIPVFLIARKKPVDSLRSN